MFSRILVTFAFLFGLLSLTTHAQQQPKLMLPIGHTDLIDRILVSRDNKYLLSTENSASNPVTKVFELSSGKELFDLPAGAVLSKNGERYLLIDPSVLSLYETFTGNLISSISISANKILDFDPTGNYAIVSLADEKAISLVDVVRNKILFNYTNIEYILKGSRDYFRPFYFSNTGKYAVFSNEVGDNRFN